MISLSNQYKRVRRTLSNEAKKRKKDELDSHQLISSWQLYGEFDWVSGVRRKYNSTFRELLRNKEGNVRTLEDVVDERSNTGMTTHTLDLLGNGSCFVEGSNHTFTDSNTAVELVKHCKREVVHVIEHDIFDDVLWDALLPKRLQDLDAAGFDIIVSRSGGGLKNLTSLLGNDIKIRILIFQRIMYELLKKAYELLSVNNGEMYLQTFGCNNVLESFVQVMRTRGILILRDKNCIRITKTTESPLRLPTIREISKEVKEDNLAPFFSPVS